MASGQRLHSEAEFLRLVDRHFSNTHPHMALGRGDDCAELVCPPLLCLTSDLFLEDVHFRTSYFSPADIGYKALAVNFSDLAAAGARPVGWNMNLMLPTNTELDHVDAILRGMAELAGEYDAPLTGGDLSRADKLGVSITAWGAPHAGVKLLRRSGTRPGESLFLGRSGEHGPGLARVGLFELEAAHAAPGAESPAIRHPAAQAAHLRPRPLIELGLTLAQAGVSSLMDLSDGLARDLPRLLGHERGEPLGAEINLDPGALHPEVIAYATAHGLDPVREAWLGGEDYLLLGSCEQNVLEELLAKGVNLLPLGKVTSGPEIKLNGHCPDQAGFDHFA